MSKEKKEDLELKDEELEDVTGGVYIFNLNKSKKNVVSNCPYFYRALNKLNINSCVNCFYWVGEDGNKECSSPQKKKNLI